ncbi:hypothetical protein LTS18_004383, partial [Coniosporium uncinatum]
VSAKWRSLSRATTKLSPSKTLRTRLANGSTCQTIARWATWRKYLVTWSWLNVTVSPMEGRMNNSACLFQRMPQVRVPIGLTALRLIC